ncbi:MAG: VanZ family protein [Dolichospermum sp. JUN01]|jgi:VanZ family protein|nr:VanZ family protein [Dolichospermum sp. JUN01]MBS9393486.1 VanZ family protein [Dolichospermum sp. OL01]MCO5797121.1 VanZ family protein [Dolichospermum sp. OL03]MCS6279700.1 VanZ family protein [Dolichospermum sp.]QSV58668.1 MAG: VanZ family protein [Dolichospermum sp. LBC05a]
MKNFFLLNLSILAVLIATLYPFNFSLVDHFSIQTIITSFDNASSFQDLVNNILLFMPLGFSSTAFFQKIKIKTISKLFTIIFISAGLSLTVEILQMFLPSRSPTPADLINNTIGGIVGMICFYIWNSQSFISILSSVENSKIKNSLKKIILLFLGYILLSFLILIPWQNTINLSNWNLSYPLLLGNEATGNKPWRGYISEVHIADKAILEKDILGLFNNKSHLNNIENYLIGSYQFNDQKSYQDRIGNLPEFLSQGQLPNIEDKKGVALSSSYWLKTETPVKLLSKRIRKTSEFTIITNLATADITQTGPGRIISLSSDILHRNFTLGQQGNKLDLRLRTPITGENGADLKLSIPGIFTNTNFHYIIITYSPGNLKVYIDKLENLASFNLLELIPKHQKILYYALSFIPLGICLTFLTILAKKKLTFYRFLLPSGIILPPLIVESMLIINNDKSMSITNILIGIFFIGGTLLILRLRVSALVTKTALK